MSTKSKRKVTYHSTDAQGRPIPFLPLGGKFFNQINLPIGTLVNVSYGDGLIHIARIIKNRYGDPSAYAGAVKR